MTQNYSNNMTYQQLLDMSLGSVHRLLGIDNNKIVDILRVPNGWIYTTYYYTSGSAVSSTFVPEIVMVNDNHFSNSGIKMIES